MRLLALFLLLFAAAARAQDPDTVRGTFGRDGLVFLAGPARISLGVLVQADARFYAAENDLGMDQFLLRRARFLIKGLVGPVAFAVVPDYGQGGVELDEAWAEVPLYGSVAARAGYFKQPVGLERTRSASAIPFVERALPTAVAPDTDVGIMLSSDVGSHADIAVGIFNGVPDGQSRHGDVSDGKDVAGRIRLRPFSGALAGVTLGIAGSYGRERGSLVAPALPRYRTAGGRQIAAYIVGDAPAFASGARTRFAPQMSAFVGPASAMVEWTISTQHVERTGLASTLAARAWQVAAGLLLTGENATSGRVRPFRPVHDGGPGAIEVAGRVNGLTLDEEAFPLFIDPAGNARSATGVALGVNWYLNDVTRVSITGERTILGAAGDGEDPPAESVLFGRLQVAL